MTLSQLILEKIKNFDFDKIGEIICKEVPAITTRTTDKEKVLIAKLAELQQAALNTFEYARIMTERHANLDKFASHMECDLSDNDYKLIQIDQLLEKIVVSDPQKQISREIRDEIHVQRGRMLEDRVNYRCPCGSCGGMRTQDRFETAIKDASERLEKLKIPRTRHTVDGK